MSWSFSPVLVAAFSEACCSGTDASAPSNTTPTPDQFYWPDKPTEHSRISRFGMTCVPLTEDHGAALLTWYREASRARTSVPPGQTTTSTESDSDSTESTADSGTSSGESFAKWSPERYVWKTAQGCLFSGWTGFYGTWPRWGSMRGGECYRRNPSALPMSVSGHGLWLPTPTAHNAKEGNFPAERTRNTPTLAAVLGGPINPEFTEWMMGWPIGHTDLKPSGTDKFQSWRQQHGDF